MLNCIKLASVYVCGFIVCSCPFKVRLPLNAGEEGGQKNWLTSLACFYYKYIICQQKLNSIYSNVIICFILTPFLTPTYQSFLPSPVKLQNFITPNGPLMSVCRFGISFIYAIESIESKLISVCLIIDYSLIA